MEATKPAAEPAAAATEQPQRKIRCTPKAEMLQPRVAVGAPIRVHIIEPEQAKGAAPAPVAAVEPAEHGTVEGQACDGCVPCTGSRTPADADCGCGRQHFVRGQCYEYCTCGLSPSQPLCDGVSCVGTVFKPMTFTMDRQASNTLMCPCKRTKAPPYCDGSHINITWDDLKW